MICEKCGKEHNGNYGSGRFCSKECARSFSTLNDNSKAQKKCYCSNCNNLFLINKRASSKNYICKECRQKLKLELKINKHNQLLDKRKSLTELYNLNKSPYKEFDTIYINKDAEGNEYLYLIKHNKDNKIIKRAKVNIYRYIIELEMGRKLNYNEIVHHIDLNHFNNARNNLIVLTRQLHNTLHANKISIEEIIENNLYVYA